jgi:hypothetical protein
LTPPQTAPWPPQHSVSELLAFCGTSQIRPLLVQHCLSESQNWPDFRQRLLPLPLPLPLPRRRRASLSLAARMLTPSALAAAAPNTRKALRRV